jgi:Ca2+-binding RTX toxin-like protein
MRARFLFRWLVVGLALLSAVSVFAALAATNTVPDTKAGRWSAPIVPNDLKPSACAGLSLTNLVAGSGTLTGTDQNDLILGGPGADVIDSRGGDDCILGGGGDDSIEGGEDSDVCIGGTGSNTFSNCEATP